MKRKIMIICLILSMVWISACTPEVGEGENGSSALPSQLPKNVVFKMVQFTLLMKSKKWQKL